ncbi:MAG: AMP-binding protein [Pseudomonadales bacterium]|nr:AMP-binding protein [Pseudomonadales bacterium]
MKSTEQNRVSPISFLFPTIAEADRFALAITDQDKELNWNQLATQVFKLANYMRQLDLQPGQHIALQVGNRVEFIEVMLAGFIAGVWITPINTHLTVEEAAYILKNCQANILFYDDENTDLASNQALCEAINICELSLILRDYGDVDARLDQFSVAGGTMLYTSGTTGKPKGVKRNKPDNLGEAFDRMRAGGELFGLTGAGPHLVTGPLYHAAPMLFALYDLLNGAPLVIMSKWDTVAFLNLVERYEIVATHLVPTMFVRLLNWRSEADYEPMLDSLRLVLHGAAPIAQTTKHQMLDWWGNILVEYWGGSEAGTTTLVNSGDWKKHPGTVGKPLDHFQVYVGDDQGNPLPDQEGLLYCRHRDLEQVFEYFNDPEKHSKRIQSRILFVSVILAI